MKKNKACIPPSFLGKADEGTVQYPFDHANYFTLFSVAPKKTKERRGYWKRRNKIILQPGIWWCGQS